jgi:hypothetical protein
MLKKWNGVEVEAEKIMGRSLQLHIEHPGQKEDAQTVWFGHLAGIL